jgi:2-hydroxychromene-2-carboxylate isomerase
VTDAGVLRELAAGLGVADPEVVIAAPATKQRLRDNTAWAIERGVFGVPTLVVGDEIFWGQDAFEMAMDFLRDPRAFADPDMRAIESLPVAASRPRR